MVQIPFFPTLLPAHWPVFPGEGFPKNRWPSAALLFPLPRIRREPIAFSAQGTGFADLVLAAILLVVIPDFFGSAVRAGPAHVLLWFLAIALFFVPQALVVTHLNERLPMEGSLYEWAPTRVWRRDWISDGLEFVAVRGGLCGVDWSGHV